MMGECGGTVPPIPGVAPDDRVLMVGAYGTGNIGDEAILAGLLAQVGDRGRVEVISRDPATTTAVHGVKAVSPFQVPGALGRSNVLVVGGGGLFSNHVGPLARGIVPLGLVALGLGKRVVLHGVSIDGTTPGPVAAGLALLSRRASAVTVRDSNSARVLVDFGGAAATVIEDVSRWAQAAPIDDASRVLERAGLDLEKPIVGIAPSAVERRFDGVIRNELPALLERLPGVQFCVVPLSRHPRVRRHNDLVIARWLQRRCRGLTVLDDVYDAATAISVFSLFSAAVCMRFHSLVFAHRAGVPIVAVPYAEKCRGWLDDHPGSATVAEPGGLAREVERVLAALVAEGQ
jgi:polysaccharide pyruvyl transferase WcaK-like protein